MHQYRAGCTVLESPITKENCGEQLRELRLRNRISRDVLGKVLGTNRGTIRRQEESETAKPSDEFMNRLGAVQLLGASKLLDTERDDTEGHGVLFDPAAGGGQMIVEALRQLTGQGVAAGLTVLLLQGTNVRGKAIPLPSLSTLTQVGAGSVKALADVAAANGFQLEETDKGWRAVRAPDFLVSDADNNPLYAAEAKTNPRSGTPSKREHFKISAGPGSGKTHVLVSQVMSELGKRKKTMTPAALEARKNAAKKSADARRTKILRK